ncbi:hypothetical protein [Listeria floridensis]|uniref:hypothetical protein n=1 Tax=Listeria floridensis TaxID=1494962 RepID=UPI0019D32B1F|nr:hypothetical protein [Listeria floridensis]
MTTDININSVKDSFYNLIPELQDELRGEMRKYRFTFEDIANPQQGKIAEVFGAGGGTQIQLGTVVDWYEKLGLIREIK